MSTTKSTVLGTTIENHWNTRKLETKIKFFPKPKLMTECFCNSQWDRPGFRQFLQWDRMRIFRFLEILRTWNLNFRTELELTHVRSSDWFKLERWSTFWAAFNAILSHNSSRTLREHRLRTLQATATRWRGVRPYCAIKISNCLQYCFLKIWNPHHPDSQDR